MLVRLPRTSVDAMGRAPLLGALIPEIVRRGFQDLLVAEVLALTSAQLNERRPDRRSTLRNGYRRRLLTTQVGDLSLAIPLDRSIPLAVAEAGKLLSQLAGAPPLLLRGHHGPRSPNRMGRWRSPVLL